MKETRLIASLYVYFILFFRVGEIKMTSLSHDRFEKHNLNTELLLPYSDLNYN